MRASILDRTAAWPRITVSAVVESLLGTELARGLLRWFAGFGWSPGSLA